MDTTQPALDDELADLRARVSFLEHAQDDALEIQQRLLAENKVLRKKLAAVVQPDDQPTVEDMQTLLRAVEALQGQLQEAQAEKADLESQLAGAAAQFEDMEARLCNQQALLEAAGAPPGRSESAQLKEARNRIGALEESVQRYADEMQRQRARIESLQQQLEIAANAASCAPPDELPPDLAE